MPDQFPFKQFFIKALLALAVASLVLAAGCTPTAAPPSSNQVAGSSSTVAAPADVPVQPTVTAAKPPASVDPTATMEAQKAPTATESAPAAEQAAAKQPTKAAEPTATVAADAAGAPAPDKSFNAWCLPLDASVSNASDPLKPPKNAKMARLTQDSLVISNLPSNGCVFLYSFPQNAATDLQLEVSEANAASPFFKTKLGPVPGRTDVVYAFVRHSMIIAPPIKSVSYTFILRDPLGQALRTDQVKLNAFVQPAASGGSGSSNDDSSGNDSGGDCGCTVPLP